VILIIDNYDSFTYNLYQLIQGLIVDEVVVKRNDKITIAEIIKMNPEGIILSPGPGHPKDATVCLEIIRYLSATTPILGVCLGHQAIALVLGGVITPAKRPLHGKTRVIIHENTRLFNGIESKFIAGCYHSLIVAENYLPMNLSIDAYDENKEIMSLSHKNYPLYGIQFHPESILTLEGEKIMRNFLEIANVKTIS
jgi:anthranilate synthase/aminodeoxychorismate synthase-like glutamine amidotransferase